MFPFMLLLFFNINNLDVKLLYFECSIRVCTELGVTRYKINALRNNITLVVTK